MRTAAAFILALLILSVPAPGSAMDRDQQLDAIIRHVTPERFKEAVYEKIVKQAAIICGGYPEKQKAAPAGFLFLEQPVFQGQTPVKAVWQHRFDVSMCGRTTKVNVLLVYENSELRSGLLLPGETIASPRLQKDAMQDVLTHVYIKAPGCRDMTIIDTELAERPKELGKDPYAEVWTYKACDKTGKMLVIFTPDGQGGTYYTIKDME